MLTSGKKHNKSIDSAATSTKYQYIDLYQKSGVDNPVLVFNKR